MSDKFESYVLFELAGEYLRDAERLKRAAH